ncbi:MAG: hypothetical protein HGB12_02435, partial [Bacteroidetes bacterium]|nr:hypothetical protein [Bacteroidota bacterium]
LLYPERKVLAICGDGGFMMNCQELETAIRYNIPVVVLILNDNGFGFIKWKQKKMHFENFGLDYGNPDFSLFAKSFGAFGFRIKENAGKFAETLRQKNYNSEIIYMPDKGLYAVSYDSYSTKDEAKQALLNIAATENKDAWILKY